MSLIDEILVAIKEHRASGLSHPGEQLSLLTSIETRNRLCREAPSHSIAPGPDCRVRVFGFPIMVSTNVPEGQVFLTNTDPSLSHTGESKVRYNTDKPIISTPKGNTMTIAETHLRKIAAEQAENEAIENAEQMLAKITEYAFEDGDALRFQKLGRDGETVLYYAVIRSGGKWYSAGPRGDTLCAADDISLVDYLLELEVELDEVEVSPSFDGDAS